MQNYVLVPRFHQVQNDMAAVLAQTLPVAEPLPAVCGAALYHAVGFVDATVGTRVLRKSFEIIWLHVLIFCRP